jgi:hypothetical protein
MKVAAVSLVAACVALLIGTAVAAESPPRWAYPENNPNYKLPLDDGNLVRVPDSTAGYSRHGTSHEPSLIGPVGETGAGRRTP